MTYFAFIAGLVAGATLNLLLFRTCAAFSRLARAGAGKLAEPDILEFVPRRHDGHPRRRGIGLERVHLLHWTRCVVGIPLFLVGFGCGYFNLFLGNTYCGADGLVLHKAIRLRGGASGPALGAGLGPAQIGDELSTGRIARSVIRKPQEIGRVHRDEARPRAEIRRASLPRHRHGSSKQRKSRRPAEGDDTLWPHEAKLLLKPPAVVLHFARGRLLMDAPLAALLKFEVLDRVREIDVG